MNMGLRVVTFWDKLSKLLILNPSLARDPREEILKKTVKFTALAAASTLAISMVGIVSAPASLAAAAKPKVCLALDTGGIDDHSFNASAWAGAQSMAAKATVSYVVADANNPDYSSEVKSLVTAKCNLIIGVGFLINSAIVDGAKANPSIKFAIVDQDGLDHGADGSVYPGTAIANLRGLTFATNQSAFIGGYLAAGYSKTGKVATYGGINIPPVSIYMDGYAKGVAYYNKQNNKKVVVLGWDTVKQDGTFVGGFSDSTKAAQISKNFEQQGADVIFPVAGGLENATAQNSVTSHKSVVIGVDSDMWGQVTDAKVKAIILNSVTKGVGASVAAVIKDTAAGKFSNVTYVGTLANKGTGLAGFHNLASKVPAKLQQELRALASQITSGAVDVTK